MSSDANHLTKPATLRPAALGVSELRKPHEMIVMLPRSQRITLTGRKIYNSLMYFAQQKMVSMVDTPTFDFLFEAPLRLILRTAGSDGEDRTAAKKYLNEMLACSVDWESTAPGDGIKFRGLNMLAECILERRQGENWISFAFPPSINSALRDPGRWARIDLDIQTKLSTYEAFALYDICCRYRDNPSGVTCRYPLDWWRDALSQAPAGAEKREWRKYKSERIRPAIEEINRETDLDLELVEHKEGRLLVDVQFRVRRKQIVSKPEKAGVRTREPVDASLVFRAESHGIREDKLDLFIAQFGEKLVREKLEALEARMKNTNLGELKSTYAYLRTTLMNHDELQVAVPLQNTAPATKVRESPESPPPTVASVRAAQEALEALWMSKRFAELRVEFGQLPLDQQRALAGQALTQLAARKLLTAVLSRRADQGDFLHGMLGSEVIRVYASAKYGDNWNKRPGQERDLPESTVPASEFPPVDLSS